VSAAERELLAAVLEALTLPYDADGYDRRLLERAAWAKTALKGALNEDPADIGWNADYLRGRLRAEEAEHKGGEQRDRRRA
jgi:hypothetical protein